MINSSGGSAPWFLWWILQTVGLLFIISGIPLMRRRVPPNPLYGIRFAATLSNETVWYEINARGGRHFVLIGVAYLLILNGLLLLPGVGEMTQILLPMGFCVAAVLIDAAILYRASSRLAGSQ